jgi:hypothetical protein
MVNLNQNVNIALISVATSGAHDVPMGGQPRAERRRSARGYLLT